MGRATSTPLPLASTQRAVLAVDLSGLQAGLESRRSPARRPAWGFIPPSTSTKHQAPNQELIPDQANERVCSPVFENTAPLTNSVLENIAMFVPYPT